MNILECYASVSASRSEAVRAAQTGNLNWFKEYKSKHDLFAFEALSWAEPVFEEACLSNQVEIVKWVVANFGYKLILSGSGIPIQAACMKGHLDIVRYLLDKSPFYKHINLADQDAYAIYWAIERGQYRIVDYILNESVHKSTITQEVLDEALHRAITKRHLCIAKMLLQHGAILKDRVYNLKDKEFQYLYRAGIFFRKLYENQRDLIVAYLHSSELVASIGSSTTEFYKHDPKTTRIAQLFQTAFNAGNISSIAKVS